MPFNGSGVYVAPSLPGSFNPAISGQDATPDDWNDLLADLELALSTCLTTDGQSVVTANLPMAGFKFTLVGDATLRNQYASAGQVQDNALAYAVATGTADVIVLTLAPALTAYKVGQVFTFKATGTNTTKVTANANTIGAGAVVTSDGADLPAGTIISGQMTTIVVQDISTPTAPIFHLQTTGSAFGFQGNPQGRLTLVTATPVMSSSQASKTSIFYTPYAGNLVPIYNGTATTMLPFAELTNTTTDNTKNPAAVANDKNYDMFVWNDAGTLRLGRGPAWTDDTTRSAGTALVRVNGMVLNGVSITNGPAASRGTYVGTVRSDGSAQINWVIGAIGANGTAGLLGVWNMYNRVEVGGFVGDSTDSWNYNTATWRAANASNTMRVSAVSGLAEDAFEADYFSFFTSSASSNAVGGVGYDSTSAASGIMQPGSSSASVGFGASFGEYATQMLGFHYFQAVEICTVTTGTTTFYGDGGTPANTQNGLTYSWRA